VNKTDATLPGHGNRGTRLGNSIHGGAYQWDVKVNGFGKTSGKINITGENQGVGWNEKDIIESQTFRDRVIKHARLLIWNCSLPESESY